VCSGRNHGKLAGAKYNLTPREKRRGRG